MTDLKEFTEQQVKVAQGILQDGEPLLPVAFFIKPDNHVDIAGLDGKFFANPSRKDKLAAILIAKAKADNSVCLLLTDCWIAKPTSEAEVAQVNQHGVKSLTSKTEAIVVNIFGQGLKPMAAMCRYTRNGKELTFQPVEWLNDEETELTGRFVLDLSNSKEAV